jgi:Zn-dependent alcohol dehydrogenase
MVRRRAAVLREAGTPLTMVTVQAGPSAPGDVLARSVVSFA